MGNGNSNKNIYSCVSNLNIAIENRAWTLHCVITKQWFFCENIHIWTPEFKDEIRFIRNNVRELNIPHILRFLGSINIATEVSLVEYIPLGIIPLGKINYGSFYTHVTFFIVYSLFTRNKFQVKVSIDSWNTKVIICTHIRIHLYICCSNIVRTNTSVLYLYRIYDSLDI